MLFRSALLEIMEPLIEPIIAERERMIEIQLRKEIQEEDIKGLVAVLHDLGTDDNIIRAALKKQYHLSEEEINKYL